MHKIKRALALVLALVLTLAAVPMAVVATETGSMIVSVSTDEISVTIEKIGASGTAKLIQVAPNAYFAGDAYTGLASNAPKPVTEVGTYSCGTTQTLTFPRYAADGTDGLFCKYYLVNGSTILAGPIYATEIESVRSVPAFEAHTKKGLTLVDHETVNYAKEMGVSNTVINMDLCSLIVANEDANGNPIDHSGDDGLIPFESNGETFYFSKESILLQDWLISDYSKAGINVSLVVISWVSLYNNGYKDTYPASLVYTEDNIQTMGFNTSTDRGYKYWIAAIEFLADRYSKSAETGLVQKFIIGNEIDYAYDWYLIEPMKPNKNGHYIAPDFDIFMEEYSRTLRLANLAVKKYNSEAKVCVSLTHNWAQSRAEAYNNVPENFRQISYRPKAIVDWLVEVEGARGNYDWGLAVHPYPIGTVSSKPTVTDPMGGDGTAAPITGDADTTPWITAANLELYQLYMSRPENLYNGQVRTVSITEANICSRDENAVNEARYSVSTFEQAASLAQYYYRAACVPCIDEIACFQLTDLDVYKLGLMRTDGTKKPAYDIWKYVDTNRSYEFSEKYLKYIDSDAKSYADVMPIVESDFDWDAAWSDANIIKRTVEVPELSKDVTRVFGATRYETAYKAADMLKEQLGFEKFNTIIVADGTNFADALPGSYLACVKDAPILLVKNRNKEINEVKNYIRKNLAPGGTVFLLGGTNAIPASMEKGLEGFNIKRLGGATRYDTNLLILKEAGVGSKDIIVCTGKAFADSLSASATNLPILLVKDSLNDKQKEFLSTLDGNNIYIIGGTSAVSARLETALKAYGKVERIGGATRYDTSVMVAQKFFTDPETAVLAYAQNFPDGLSGGPLAYSMNAPLILTTASKPTAAKNYMAAEGITYGTVLGGTGLISDKIVRQIFRMKTATPILVK